MLLRKRVHRIDDAAVDQAEVTGVDRDVHVGETLEDPVEAPVGDLHEHGRLALDPLAVDDVVPLLPVA